MVDNSVVNSIMNGLAWGDQSRRQDQYLKLSVQQQQRQAIEQERRAKHEEMANQVRDMEFLQNRGLFGRSVNDDGTVDAEFEVTPELAGVSPGLPMGMKIPMKRKANSPHSYTTADGRKLLTEPFTVAERLQQETERASSMETAKGKGRAAGKTAERKSLLEEFGFDVPKPGGKPGEVVRILPDESDNVGSLLRSLQTGSQAGKPKASPWSRSVDYSNGNVSYTRVNEAGETEVKHVSEGGLASPRPRSTPTASKGRSTGTKAPTSGQITGLAEQVLAESKAGGGTSVEHAIANLENRKNYAGTPIGDNRYQIIAALKKQVPKGKTGAGANRWRETPPAPAAAAVAAPKPPQSAKAISATQVQAYATKFGITFSAAKKKAESEGYKVGQ